ncbi:MAG: response regulator [Synergistaceae bacterium]|jgi:putative two-component system response regulator|nr:response regulator [Synergistaceae bacterium]
MAAMRLKQKAEETKEPKKTVLAVDDAQSNLQVVESALRDDFVVHLAKSGSMAIIALQRFVPDLILLDIEMPRVSGFDVMEEIRNSPRLRKVPVIFLTSHAEADSVVTALRKGAKDYIVKPFDPTNLRERVHKVLAQSSGQG